MKSKILIYVEDEKYLSDYRKAGVSAFLFALEDFSVGYKTYTLEEINNIEVSNKYILINRLLDCEDIDKLKEIKNKFTNIKGIIYEDIGVYQIFKDTKDIELISFQNHFGTNTSSVKFWLSKVDSIFISNEITYDEIKEITLSADKPVCLHLYGYNQVMYSRRKLLTNWSEEFNIPYKNNNLIEDKATHVRFHALESEYGTVMYSENIFNGKELLNLENVKFFYVNTMLIDHEQIMSFLNDFKNGNNEDDGFLHKETIYKLKERNK